MEELKFLIFDKPAENGENPRDDQAMGQLQIEVDVQPARRQRRRKTLWNRMKVNRLILDIPFSPLDTFTLHVLENCIEMMILIF